MGFIEMVVFSSAINIDTFVVSLCFGTILSRSRVIPPIAFIIALIECLVPFVGFIIGNIAGSHLGELARYVGAGLLILVGIQMLSEGSKSASTFMEDNLLLVYLGAGLDDLLAGVSIGTLGGRLPAFLLIYFLVAFCLNLIALSLGKWIRKYISFPTGAVTGLVLIAMGVLEIIGLA